MREGGSFRQRPGQAELLRHCLKEGIVSSPPTTALSQNAVCSEVCVRQLQAAVFKSHASQHVQSVCKQGMHAACKEKVVAGRCFEIVVQWGMQNASHVFF